MFMRSGAYTTDSTFLIVLNFARRVELGSSGEDVCRLISERRLKEARAALHEAIAANCAAARKHPLSPHEALVSRNQLRLELMLEDLERTLAGLTCP